MKKVEKLKTDLAASTIHIRPGWSRTGSVKKFLGEPDYYTPYNFGRMGWYRCERVFAVEARPDFNIGSGRVLKPLPGYTVEQWREMSPQARDAARYRHRKSNQ